jgi:LPXTG-site transpeptidase (sortase) family protein
VIEITIVTRVNSLGQPPIQNEAQLVSDPPLAGVSPDPVQNNASLVDLQIVTPSDNNLDSVQALPSTGFAPNKITTLPEQTAEQAYTDLGDFWLEVPSLGIKMPIVGVPKAAETWNVDWLWNQAGWLEGSAFPTWQGNSVLTGHVYLPNGLPGPFVALNKLRWGDKVIVHAFGQRHIYEVRANRVVLPGDVSVLKHEEQAWLSLVTCKGYNAMEDVYRYRIAIQAVLMNVEAER